MPTNNYFENKTKTFDKFLISQANKGYLNGLAAEMGESTNSIRKTKSSS